MIPWLGEADPFPPLASALVEPNGLLAAGLDLTPRRLLAAYLDGIFPWFNEGEPVLWWSPDPRMVLFTDELRVTRSLSKVLRNRHYTVTVDAAFRQVMQACAQAVPDRPATWITDDIVEAYCNLHERGLAHSVETWIDGELAGGLYGVAIGRMFYGESMFCRQRDASKIAFVHLVRRLAEHGVGMIDCQMHTDHLASLGAREIARSDFVARLKQATAQTAPDGLWTGSSQLLVRQ